MIEASRAMPIWLGIIIWLWTTFRVVRAVQFLRRSKRTARTTRNVVQSQMMMPSQIGIAREASIIHQHISRLAQGQLLNGQLDLAQPTGFQAPIQSDPVQ